MAVALPDPISPGQLAQVRRYSDVQQDPVWLAGRNKSIQCATAALQARSSSGLGLGAFALLLGAVGVVWGIQR